MKRKMDDVEPRGIPKEIEEKIKRRKQMTELVFILDKSGSMAGMVQDTIGGFNAMLEQQKQTEGIVYVSTVLFANTSQVLHDRKLLTTIQPLTKKEYQVGGCTALLDAIGETIQHIGNIHKYARPEDVPARTLFVITTDGMENASRTYNSNQIKEMIREMETEKGWEFLFLASNIDAVETAERIGIGRDRAIDYAVESETREMFEELSETICEYRTRNAMPTSCKIRFEERIKARKTTNNKGENYDQRNQD